VRSAIEERVGEKSSDPWVDDYHGSIERYCGFRIMQVLLQVVFTSTALRSNTNFAVPDISFTADGIRKGKGKDFEDVFGAWQRHSCVACGPILLNDDVESGWERGTGSIHTRCG
jgi:hypothetical protein